MSGIPDYTVYDNQLSDEVQQQFTNLYGMNSAGAIDATAMNISKNQLPGQSKDDLSRMQAIINDKFMQYQDGTLSMVMQNDMNNVNSYLSESVSNENARSQRLLESTNNALYKAKQAYMMKKYDIAYTQFVSGLLQFTLFTVIICSFILALIFSNVFNDLWGYSIIIMIISLYLIILVLFIRQNMMRRKDDWNKFYYTTGKNSKSCSG